jgi:hypothetical protein
MDSEVILRPDDGLALGFCGDCGFNVLWLSTVNQQWLPKQPSSHPTHVMAIVELFPIK